jgi:hypothetical protein
MVTKQTKVMLMELLYRWLVSLLSLRLIKCVDWKLVIRYHRVQVIYPLLSGTVYFR